MTKKLTKLQKGSESIDRTLSVTRKRVESQRDNQTNHFELLAEHCSVGIWHITASGHTIYINPLLCELLEVDDSAELEGRTYHEFFTEESLEVMKQEHARRKQGYASHYEVELIGIHGRRTRCLISGVPILDDNGELVSLIGTFSDLTRIYSTEQALSERELHYERLVNSLQDGLMVLSADDRISYCNPALCELLGYRSEELIGTDPLNLLDEEYREMVKQQLLLRRGHHSSQYEVVYLKKDGSSLPALISGSPLFGDDGSYQGAFGITKDLTKLRDLESQLLQSGKMEAMGRLAGGVAHDFNNLLGVILGAVEMLQHDFRDDEQLSPFLSEIQKAAQRGTNLSKQLLAFSRKQVLEKKVLDLGEVTTNFRSMLERLLRDDITLVLELDSDPLTVRADQTQLEMIVLNLAINAQDSMPTGGEVQISLDTVELEHPPASLLNNLRSGKYVRLTVRDSGCGMNKDVIKQIFDPFFTTKERGRGTGLGLPIVHGILVQQQGDLEIDSVPGEGTSFRVYLEFEEGSVADAPQPESASSTERPLPSKTYRVLVVDDEPPIRKLIGQILTRFGYETYEAEDVDAAIEMAGNEKIDLLVTDVVMPGLRGPELFAELSKSLPELKVIYMSGYSGADSNYTAQLCAETTRFLQKPFALPKLLDAVEETLEEVDQSARKPSSQTIEGVLS